MLKKFLYVLIILFSFLIISNICYASDISTVPNTDVFTTTDNTSDANQSIDNTTYSQPDTTTADANLDFTDSTVTSISDYEDSADLSISNIINIILIVVGVVLILLGIAIIIKIK